MGLCHLNCCLSQKLGNIRDVAHLGIYDSFSKYLIGCAIGFRIFDWLCAFEFRIINRKISGILNLKAVIIKIVQFANSLHYYRARVVQS